MVQTKIPVKVQKRSGFDKSHHNALTQKVGTITPILCDEIIPNTKIKLRYAMAGSMPPLAFDAYMKVYYDVRAFFVPMRLLYGGFESWFSDYAQPTVTGGTGGNTITNVKSVMPYFALASDSDLLSCVGSGSLADYLGFKVDLANWDSEVTGNVIFSMLPFMAYHRVCNDWFRQPNVTKEYFARPDFYPQITGVSRYFPAMLPFVSLDSNSCICALGSSEDVNNYNLKFADGISIFSLRQANFDYDYFTNGLPSAQLGLPMTVASASSFSIPALRVANSLQQFAELNMLAGANEVDICKARYGANLSRGVAQRAIYLGGSRLDLSTKAVEVTANANSVSSSNPFKNSVGSTGGRVYCQGSDVIIDGFTAEEPGYVLVVGTLIPKVTYAVGIRRYLKHYCQVGSLVEMANPLLQNIGNQEIYDYELTGSIGTPDESNTFGYTDRYAEFMTMEDECHGQFVLGQSLGSFIAQRYFYVTSNPTIGTNFLEIPTNFLDNVTAVNAAISNYGFFAQFAFDYKVSQPLAQYSLPSLQNPAYEHGVTVKIHRGGFRF